MGVAVGCSILQHSTPNSREIGEPQGIPAAQKTKNLHELKSFFSF